MLFEEVSISELSLEVEASVDSRFDEVSMEVIILPDDTKPSEERLLIEDIMLEEFSCKGELIIDCDTRDELTVLTEEPDGKALEIGSSSLQATNAPKKHSIALRNTI
ncbi:MAG: hypothetical protein IJ393_06750 [Clostridia bacterium]|nr:hypothetical protein [Clostridia bacterium]